LHEISFTLLFHGELEDIGSIGEIDIPDFENHCKAGGIIAKERKK
jgi:hypothetical protein